MWMVSLEENSLAITYEEDGIGEINESRYETEDDNQIIIQFKDKASESGADFFTIVNYHYDVQPEEYLRPLEALNIITAKYEDSTLVLSTS